MALPCPTPSLRCTLPLPAYPPRRPLTPTQQISFHDSHSLQEVGAPYSLRMPRESTVGELLEELRRQLPPEAHQQRPLRLMEVYQVRKRGGECNNGSRAGEL